MPLILPANTLDSSYEIDNSLRFDGSSSFLRDTLGTPTSQKTFTFSCWAKGLFQRSGSIGSRLCSAGANGDAHYTGILHFVRTNGTPQIYISDSAGKYLNFNNHFYRDPSAWYHFVVAIDTTQGVATNRTKLYINGTQLSNTVASHEEQPDADYDWPTLASGQLITIGANSQSDASFYDGYMADVYFIDGQAKAPTDFGEFDEDSGIWKPIKYTGTFGNNGFKLEFKETGTGTASASTIGADTSGNTNHLTSTNLAATDVTTDTPTNNFATMNPLDAGSEGTLSEGNCKYTGGTTTGQGQLQMAGGTFGVSNGKWYFEVKKKSNEAFVGIYAAEHGAVNIGYTNPFQSGWNGYSHGIYTADGNARNGNADTSYGSAIHDDDIIGVALDLDNGAIYYSDNGTFMDSGDPTSGASKTGAASNFTTTVETWILGFTADGGSAAASVYEFNFGNPIAALSSGNADANGYGNFEYAPPSGYYAPCTKNLAEFG
jgi:hypothetical protein